MPRSTRRRLVPLLALVVTTLAVVVGAEPAGAQEAPAATVAASGELGGQLAISGTGWTHPDGTGSSIGIKIDEGAYSRPDGATVHANATIWAIVDANPDGTFSTTIDLPDGTTTAPGGSLPALAAGGSHTLRLLTGSLKPGDTPRTLASTEFTVVGDPSDDPNITITAEVPDDGALALSVATNSVDLGPAELTAGLDALVSSGALPAVTVADLRSADPGWEVTGQVTDFTGPGDPVPGTALGWTPSVTSTADGQTVSAGDAVAPGSGLAAGRTLASAPAGAGRGTALLGAGLELHLPTDAAPGTYSAVLTLTAV